MKSNFRVLIKGKGKPLLLLPGFAIYPEMCDPVVKELAKSYLVIVPYLPDLASFSNLNDLIVKKLNELKIKDKIILVSHSMGAMLAVKFVLKYKNKVNKLIISDGLILPHEKTFFQTAGDIVADTLYNIFDPSDWKNLILSLYGHAKFFSKNPVNFKYQMDFAMKNSVENDLPKINIPTMILWGKRDKVISSNNAEKIHKKIPKSKLEIVNGNHLWLLQNPKLLKVKTDQFVNEN